MCDLSQNLEPSIVSIKLGRTNYQRHNEMEQTFWQEELYSSSCHTCVAATMLQMFMTLSEARCQLAK